MGADGGLSVHRVVDGGLSVHRVVDGGLSASIGSSNAASKEERP
jgi:hypothetical protein